MSLFRGGEAGGLTRFLVGVWVVRSAQLIRLVPTTKQDGQQAGPRGRGFDLKIDAAVRQPDQAARTARCGAANTQTRKAKGRTNPDNPDDTRCGTGERVTKRRCSTEHPTVS